MNLLKSVSFFRPPALLVFPVDNAPQDHQQSAQNMQLHACRLVVRALFVVLAFFVASPPVCVLVVTTITLRTHISQHARENAGRALTF